MTTSSPISYNEANEQAARTPIFCERTKKLLTRIDTASIAELATVSGGQWCWCRGCHMEHHILWSDIAQMR